MNSTRSDEWLPGQAPREIVTVGDPRLLQENRPVTPETRQEAIALSRLMVRKLRALQGQGLAAPQLGVDLRVVVVETRSTLFRPEASASELYVMFNPEITFCSRKKAEDWEGCFSFFPRKLFGLVPRHVSVEVKFLDPVGNRRQERFDGLLARAVQHEIDHLDGWLYVDRMPFSSTRRAADLFTTDKHRKTV